MVEQIYCPKVSQPVSFFPANVHLFVKQKPKNQQSKHKMIKTKWTPEEDKLLSDAVQEFGTNNWTLIATRVQGRTGKQCRERWTGQVCPTISKLDWTQAEDMILFQYQRVFGNKWAKIAQFLPNRSPISVKNRWNWYVRHKNHQVLQPSLTQKVSLPLQTQVGGNHPPKTVEKIYFEPISKIDNGLFGQGFEEFKAKVFAGFTI